MNGWHVIRCTPGREARAVDRLAQMGYPGGWYPPREERIQSGADRRAKRRGEQRGPAKRKAAEFTGYIFLPGDIDPHAIRSAPNASLWIGPLIVNGQAVVISEADMLQMKKLPEILRARLDALQAAERAERLAKVPQIGERATVVDGPHFVGFDGLVKAIDGESAALDVGGLIRQIVVPLAYVERASSQQCA